MKLFIWDFHGVLEKGNDDAVLEITNRALKEHGISRSMTRNEGISLSGLKWHEYFSFLLPDASHEECIKLQSTCFNIQENHPEIVAGCIQLNDHADLVLSGIENSEHHQILISNTLPRALDVFVETVGVGKYFPLSHRFGVNGHEQKIATKKSCLHAYLKENEAFEAIISIGDSPGDMALVEESGIGYLYTHPERTHRSAPHHYKIHDLRTVLQEIQPAGVLS